jgi:hypothetical protein
MVCQTANRTHPSVVVAVDFQCKVVSRIQIAKGQAK